MSSDETQVTTKQGGAAMSIAEADRRQDLYFGLVRAIGTDLEETIGALASCLRKAGYHQESVHRVKLSSFLDQLANDGHNSVSLSSQAEGRFRYYESRMDAGDRARETHGPDVLSMMAVAEAARLRSQDSSSIGRYGDVFVFDSLMHPDEVDLLRSAYGKRFFLLAVYSGAAAREAKLLAELKSTDPHEQKAPNESALADNPDAEAEARKAYQSREERRRSEVRTLMDRDEGLSELTTALSPAHRSRRVAIRKTFALADVFVSSQEILTVSPHDQPDVLERFIMKIFDEPFMTPTRAELGMAHAYVAARRSGSLARNVGAAITTVDGDLLSVGTNEVPTAGGGQYWPLYDGAESDHRDYRFAGGTGGPTEPGSGRDSNDVLKTELVKDLLLRVLEALPDEAELDKEQRELFEQHIYAQDEVANRLLTNDKVTSARAFDVIEYGRQVHAEMAAIVSCARRGISTKGTVLYCTTFPCHECARHIVAAGIHRVVYVEPYPKSRVADLHSDSVTVELHSGRPGSEPPSRAGDRYKVAFEPYFGVSPDRHSDIYSGTRRKVEKDTASPDAIGRARFWTFGPSCSLRPALTAGRTTIGIGEAVRVAATETYITNVLEQKGLAASDSTSGKKEREADPSIKAIGDSIFSPSDSEDKR